jgi:hypothetical protein
MPLPEEPATAIGPIVKMRAADTTAPGEMVEFLGSGWLSNVG